MGPRRGDCADPPDLADTRGMRAFRWATKLSVAAEPGDLAPDTLIDLRSVLASEFDDVEIRFTETPFRETRVEVVGVIEARSGTEAIRVKRHSSPHTGAGDGRRGMGS